MQQHTLPDGLTSPPACSAGVSRNMRSCSKPFRMLLCFHACKCINACACLCVSLGAAPSALRRYRPAGGNRACTRPCRPGSRWGHQNEGSRPKRHHNVSRGRALPPSLPHPLTHTVYKQRLGHFSNSLGFMVYKPPRC